MWSCEWAEALSVLSASPLKGAVLCLPVKAQPLSLKAGAKKSPLKRAKQPRYAASLRNRLILAILAGARNRLKSETNRYAEREN